ncbi:MAG: hypothetical protein WBA45_00750 [Microthrixaceae bacterium]
MAKFKVAPWLAILAGVLVLAACTDGGWPAPTTASTTTIPSSSTTLPGSGCEDYTPTHLAIGQTTVMAGDQVTVSGIAMSSDSVEAKLSGGTIGTVTLGTAAADGSGQFSITANLPTPLDAGSYTITVTSTQCPTPGSLMITVVAGTPGSCQGSRASRTFRPGQNVNWTLDTSNFSSIHDVSLKISRTGYSQVLYTGPWPASGTVAVAIPSAAPSGQYTVVQTGTKRAGNSGNTSAISKSCPVWIELRSVVAPADSAPGASVEGAVVERPSGEVQARDVVLARSENRSQGNQRAAVGSLPFTGGDAVSLTIIALVMVLVGFTLMQLRRRQSA